MGGFLFVKNKNGTLKVPFFYLTDYSRYENFNTYQYQYNTAKNTRFAGNKVSEFLSDKHTRKANYKGNSGDYRNTYQCFQYILLRYCKANRKGIN